MAKMETKLAPVEGILWIGSKEQKENVAFVLWRETNPNSGCLRSRRREVEDVAEDPQGEKC
jgi:hypothetical protein